MPSDDHHRNSASCDLSEPQEWSTGLAGKRCVGPPRLSDWTGPERTVTVFEFFLFLDFAFNVEVVAVEELLKFVLLYEFFFESSLQFRVHTFFIFCSLMVILIFLSLF